MTQHLPTAPQDVPMNGGQLATYASLIARPNDDDAERNQHGSHPALPLALRSSQAAHDGPTAASELTIDDFGGLSDALGG